MKNYIVRAATPFDDYEGLEIKPENPKKHRNLKDIFNVTKERYEYLKKLNLVILVGIDKKEESKIKSTKKTTSKK
jgi:hypothetical protein